MADVKQADDFEDPQHLRPKVGSYWWIVKTNSEDCNRNLHFTKNVLAVGALASLALLTAGVVGYIRQTTALKKEIRALQGEPAHA